MFVLRVRVMQCNYIFSYCIKFCRDVLRVHEKLHTSPALCRVCGKKFPEVKGLQAHTASVHAEKVYQCPRCRKQFAAETMLERHMLVAHSSQSAEFKCLPSGHQMANEAAVKTHVLAVHSETKASLQCPSCSKSFLRETQLQKHTELRHGSKASVARKPLQPPFSQQPSDVSYRCQHCAVGGTLTECATLYFYQLHLSSKHKCPAVAVLLHAPVTGISGPAADAGCPCVQCSVDLGTYAKLASFLRKRLSVPRNHVCAVCRKTFRTAKVIYFRVLVMK